MECWYDDNDDKKCSVISVASGKGGVGKTLTTVHLAYGLAEAGKKVLILDGDMGLSNVDIVLGLDARYNINDAIEDRVSMADIILSVTDRIGLISSGSGLINISELSIVQKVKLLDKLDEISDIFDYLIVDCGAGIGGNVQHFTNYAPTNLVLTTPEPHSMTDAYATMKVMNQHNNKGTFHLVVNMVKSDSEGQKVYQRISDTASRFLNIDVKLSGIVHFDETLSNKIVSSKIDRTNVFTTVAGQGWRRVAHNIKDSLRSSRIPKEVLWKSILHQNREMAI